MKTEEYFEAYEKWETYREAALKATAEVGN